MDVSLACSCAVDYYVHIESVHLFPKDFQLEFEQYPVGDWSISNCPAMAASLLRPPRDPFDTTRQRLPGWSDDTSTLPAQSRNPAGPFDNAEADHRVDSPRTLTQTDVTALVINNMIGTGIFTGPYIVLVNTQSKSVAMGLWVAGFTHTIARYRTQIFQDEA